MANTKLSEIGGVLQDSRGNELIVSAIGAATGKPGDLCGILTTGVIEFADLDSTTADTILGLLLPKYDVDMDTAPGASVPVEIVIPQAGHIYGAHGGAASTAETGWSLELHATSPGLMTECTNVEDAHIAKYYKVAASDEFFLVVWGA